MRLLVNCFEVPTITSLPFHSCWLGASVYSLGSALFCTFPTSGCISPAQHWRLSLLLWFYRAGIELVIVLLTPLKIWQWNDWQPSSVVCVCMLKIFRFLHKFLHLGPWKRLLRKIVLCCKIQGAAGSREGPQTTPRDFFSDRIGCQFCLILLELLKTSHLQGACWEALQGY